MAAALFSTSLMGSMEAMPFYYYLMVLFLVALPWDVLDLDVRYPRTNLLFELVAKVLGSLVFLAGIILPGVIHSTEDVPMAVAVMLTVFRSPTMSVFLFFWVLLAYVSLVIDSFERLKMTGDRLSYNLIYSVIFVLLSSAGFGRLHYEHVESAFGGGEPRVVEILIDRQEIRDGLKDMDVDVNPILRGKLVHESQRELIIDVGGASCETRDRPSFSLPEAAGRGTVSGRDAAFAGWQ